MGKPWRSWRSSSSRGGISDGHSWPPFALRSLETAMNNVSTHAVDIWLGRRHPSVEGEPRYSDGHMSDVVLNAPKPDRGRRYGGRVPARIGRNGSHDQARVDLRRQRPEGRDAGNDDGKVDFHDGPEDNTDSCSCQVVISDNIMPDEDDTEHRHSTNPARSLDVPVPVPPARYLPRCWVQCEASQGGVLTQSPR